MKGSLSPSSFLFLSGTLSQSKLLITRDHNNVKNSPPVRSFFSLVVILRPARDQRPRSISCDEILWNIDYLYFNLFTYARSTLAHFVLSYKVYWVSRRLFEEREVEKVVLPSQWERHGEQLKEKRNLGLGWLTYKTKEWSLNEEPGSWSYRKGTAWEWLFMICSSLARPSVRLSLLWISCEHPAHIEI